MAESIERAIRQSAGLIAEQSLTGEPEDGGEAEPESPDGPEAPNVAPLPDAAADKKAGKAKSA